MLFAGIRICLRFRIKADALEEAVEPTGKPNQEREKATEASQLVAKESKPILETGVALRVLAYPWLRSTAVVTRLIERGAFRDIASRLLGLRHCLPKPECGG